MRSYTRISSPSGIHFAAFVSAVLLAISSEAHAQYALARLTAQSTRADLLQLFPAARPDLIDDGNCTTYAATWRSGSMMCETLEVAPYSVGGIIDLDLVLWFRSNQKLHSFRLTGVELGTREYLRDQDVRLRARIAQVFGPDFCSRNLCSIQIGEDKKRPGMHESHIVVVATKLPAAGERR